MESALNKFFPAVGIECAKPNEKEGHDTNYDSTTSSSTAPESSPRQSASTVPDTPSTVNVDGAENHGYLFGQNITNSYSPLLHDAIYKDLGLNWEQFRLDSSDIPRFLELIKDPRFVGASVTMPNKVAILSYLDELTPECRDVGACNTLYIRTREDGSRVYCGTNTDTIGIRESFYQNISDPDAVFHGRPALVVGGGGAARSAVYALRRWMKVTDIYLVNRDDSEVKAIVDECTARGYGKGLKHIKTVQQAEAAEAVGAIVACVPDFSPQTEEEKQARNVTKALLDKEFKGAMLEMCYNPTPFTKLGGIAQRAGWKVILGTEAMIWQGIEQVRYWVGDKMNELSVKNIQHTIAAKLQEVVAAKA